MAEDAIPDTRVCRKCGEAKPLSPEFFSTRFDNGHLLYRWHCKPCRCLLEVERRQADLDTARARDRQRYLRPERRTRMLAYRKAWYEANKDRVSALAKSPEGRAAGAARKRKQLCDPIKRMHTRIGSAIRYSLNGNKKGRWQELVGYTIAELKTHIERQFSKGMSWDAFGRGAIHIDHIVPLAEFRIASADCPAFRAAWALTNLRPLWAADNLKKSSKRTHLL